MSQDPRKGLSAGGALRRRTATASALALLLSVIAGLAGAAASAGSSEGAADRPARRGEAAAPPGGPRAAAQPERTEDEEARPEEPEAAAGPAIRSQRVRVLGQALHYLEGGRGRPIILLHGMGGAAPMWRPLMTDLAPIGRPIALDMIGFGRSDKPHIDYRMGTFLDFLLAFMKEKRLPRADLVGHSMGARIASLFALRHPERVGRLVLIDGAAYPPVVTDDMARAFNASTLAEARRQLELLYFDDASQVTDTAVERSFAGRLLSGTAHSVERVVASYRAGEDFASSMASITAPTLIVWGREDEISPVADAERANREIAGSRLVVLDRCGHLPQIEAAEALRAAVVPFLAEGRDEPLPPEDEPAAPPEPDGDPPPDEGGAVHLDRRHADPPGDAEARRP